MIIKVADDLSYLDVYANGIELASIMGMDRKDGKRVFTWPDSEEKFVHRFEKPVLMTDDYQIGQAPSELRSTLFALYGCKPRIVEYAGVSVFWDETHKNVWCPSIDTILYASALIEVLKMKRAFGRVAEIGCGSGFLSKLCLKKKINLKSLIVNDLNRFAVKCAMDNIVDDRALFTCGDGLRKISGQKFDLLICNPPYVPRKGSIDDNPYEGISLLNHLLHYGQDYLNRGGILVTTISSLCEDLVLTDWPKMKMRTLREMRVPLKINNLYNNQEWKDFLLKERGLEYSPERGYNYWQIIKIVMLEK